MAEIEETRDGNLLLIKVAKMGPQNNNAYIVVDAPSNNALIVDAPAESELVVDAVKEFNVRNIIVTHRHPDHWAGIEALLSGIQAPVYTHEEDKQRWETYVNGTLAHGEDVELGSLKLRVIHTPGHSPGSICLQLGEHLLSGDTLFPGGPGRSFKPEDFRQEVDSIVSRLYVLPESTSVYPGHGTNTTIGASRAEYEIFAGKQHDPELYGDVNWLTS